MDNHPGGKDDQSYLFMMYNPLILLVVVWLSTSSFVCAAPSNTGASSAQEASTSDNDRQTRPAPTLEDAVGFTREGNPSDRYRRPILDPAFVVQAIETPSPSEKTWRRLNELLESFDRATREETVRHIQELYLRKPKPNANELNTFIWNLRSRLLYVRGGKFIMGDWGELQKPIAPVSSEENDGPPFVTTLDSFSLMQYRVTFAEYDLYTRDRGLPPHAISVSLTETEKHPNRTPARKLRLRFPDFPVIYITWQEARNYCLWLGEVTGQRFDLPTEAQWEYAARSRGKKYVMGVAELDPYKIDPRKIEDGWKAAGRITSPDYLFSRPIGTFGANEIGLYDTIGYGEEWVLDNYGQYDGKPKTNPRGPDAGTTKVRRIAHGIRPSTQRSEADPAIPDIESNFRCALNRRSPWK